MSRFFNLIGSFVSLKWVSMARQFTSLESGRWRVGYINPSRRFHFENKLNHITIYSTLNIPVTNFGRRFRYKSKKN